MAKSLITCDCLGTQSIDSDGLSKATGLAVKSPCTALCTHQLDIAAKALSEEGAIICCAQEATRFQTLAEELGVAEPAFLDLRDRAGWTADDRPTLPKMSALIAEAALQSVGPKTIDVISEGMCLVLGPPDIAMSVAEQLKDHLSVTVLSETAPDTVPTSGFDVVVGRLRNAVGAIGNFKVTIDGLQEIEPGGRGAVQLSEPRNGGQSQCDIILDLRKDTPLFPAHEKRDGYLRADPSHAAAVGAAVLDASHLVGTFEKTLHVKTQSLMCAHSRAEQTGCTRCLDLCPTGAISPTGEHVTVDPLICAGCGACSAACPSGAIELDAPSVDQTILRVQTLAKAYLDAGGQSPRLLVVNAHGSDMIRLVARHGGGLPADVIPMEVDALNGFGHAEIAAALAAGFASVSLVPSVATDRAALSTQVAIAQAIAGSGKVSVLDTSDPDVMSETLFVETAPEPCANPVRPMGTRRQITRQAAKALQAETETVALPEGAPYGAVLVDTDSCTLCLSCVSLCPSGALGDNSDLPQLRFQEDACLQCGLCANICPENAITYEPRLNLTDAALSQVVLNEEEPFACIKCSKLFGSKSTIERITEKLQGHSMFSDPDKLSLIQMCDDCRVDAQFHSENNPFEGAERPRVRTTEDYLSKRRDH